MTESPATIAPSATLAVAARLLEDLEIRHLPVVDGSGQLVGMLSDRDLRTIGSDAPAPSTRIVDVMNSNVVQAHGDDDLGEIADLMIDNRIGAVPIIDERGLLVGIVSYVDVLRTISSAR